MAQINEVDAFLRAIKYFTAIDGTPLPRLKSLKKLTEHSLKPQLHGLTRSREETLAQAIAHEGPEILHGLLNPQAYYKLYDGNTQCSTWMVVTYL